MVSRRLLPGRVGFVLDLQGPRVRLKRRSAGFLPGLL